MKDELIFFRVLNDNVIHVNRGDLFIIYTSLCGNRKRIHFKNICWDDFVFSHSRSLYRIKVLKDSYVRFCYKCYYHPLVIFHNHRSDVDKVVKKVGLLE